jgi:hypothetical protein
LLALPLLLIIIIMLRLMSSSRRRDHNNNSNDNDDDASSLSLLSSSLANSTTRSGGNNNNNNLGLYIASAAAGLAMEAVLGVGVAALHSDAAAAAAKDSNIALATVVDKAAIGLEQQWREDMGRALTWQEERMALVVKQQAALLMAEQARNRKVNAREHEALRAAVEAAAAAQRGDHDSVVEVLSALGRRYRTATARWRKCTRRPRSSRASATWR